MTLFNRFENCRVNGETKFSSIVIEHFNEKFNCASQESVILTLRSLRNFRWLIKSVIEHIGEKKAHDKLVVLLKQNLVIWSNLSFVLIFNQILSQTKCLSIPNLFFLSVAPQFVYRVHTTYPLSLPDCYEPE